MAEGAGCNRTDGERWVKLEREKTGGEDDYILIFCLFRRPLIEEFL